MNIRWKNIEILMTTLTLNFIIKQIKIKIFSIQQCGTHTGCNNWKYDMIWCIKRHITIQKKFKRCKN